MRPMERLRWLAVWAFKVVACWMVACIGLVVLLRFVPLPVSMVMLEKWGYGLVTGEPMALQHDWVPMEQISNNARLAVNASEDQKFPDHYGFDVDQIVKAIDARLAGERLRGASTISQQTAKNVFLWNGRSWVRKGLEVWFTILIEMIWPKERILEVYLNVAEWGPGVFGVEAAAEHQEADLARAARQRSPPGRPARGQGEAAGHFPGSIQTSTQFVHRKVTAEPV